jgi:hypothetical protein
VSLGKTAVVSTLAISLGLGTYAFLAIKRTAARRVALVDDVAEHFPAIVNARVLSPWEPAAYADDVRAMYCLDEADPETGAGRLLNALLPAGWTTTDQRRDPVSGAVVLTLSGPIRLRAGLAHGNRPDCDGAKRQVTVALDGTR